MIDTLLGLISDYILDGLWAGLVEAQYIHAAAHVAFTLAFIVVVSSDDQATMASKKQRNFK
jgi:hypothetical protein